MSKFVVTGYDTHIQVSHGLGSIQPLPFPTTEAKRQRQLKVDAAFYGGCIEKFGSGFSVSPVVGHGSKTSAKFFYATACHS